MKKLILLFVLPFLFMMLSSFSLPQQIPKDEIKDPVSKTEDIKVGVQFEPANIYVRDQRNVDYLRDAYKANAESVDNIAYALTNIKDFIPFFIEQEERRLGPVLSQLEVKYKMDANRIEKAINTHKLVKESLIGIGLISVVWMLFTIGTEVIDLARLLYITSIYSVIATASLYFIYIICSYLVPALVDYHYLVDLIRLSG